MPQQPPQQISQADRDEWFHSPVTQAFLAELLSVREEGKEDWAREAFVGATADQSHLMNAKALGGLVTLQSVIDNVLSHNATEPSDD